MGRCPVRSGLIETPENIAMLILMHSGLFEEALEALAKHQSKLGFMFENIVPMSKAVEYYDLFNEMKVQKVRSPVLLTRRKRHTDLCRSSSRLTSRYGISFFSALHSARSIASCDIRELSCRCCNTHGLYLSRRSL